MLNENPRQIKTWFQNIAFIFLLLGVLSFRLTETRTLPSGDESYHISNDLANTPYSDFNVFKAHHYRFIGHPLGYPLSMKMAFSLLGPSVETARKHSLFFSFMTLFVFFLIAREFLWFPAAALITLAFYSSTSFYNLTPRILGDMSFLMFSLLSIYCLYRNFFLGAALSALLAVFFRETGLAVIAGFFCSYVLLWLSGQREQIPRIKKILIITLPAFLFLSAFFINNWIRYDSFSRHPYALGTLAHTHVHFFSWGQIKWQTLTSIRRSLLRNLDASLCLWLAVSVSYMVLKKKGDRLFPLFCFVFFALFVLIFFIFYGDTLVRDILPTICFLFFMLAYSLQFFSRPLQAITAALILALEISRLHVVPFSVGVKAYKETAHFIEQNYADKKIYFGWPLSGMTDKIYGYFTHPPHFVPYQSSDLDVVITDSEMSKLLKQSVFEAIKKQGLKRTKQVSFGNLSLTVFEKPSQNKNTSL